MQKQNLVVVSEIITQLENQKELDSIQLLDIYLKHFPKMKSRRMTSLERVSRIVWELDKNQQVVAEFDRRGDVNRVVKKSSHLLK